ncbi:hypothetical protein ACIPWF_23475 [Paenarthrobacter sp. NPDC089989]|uniref:hypothetical protein n=1 Tax=unclassified Paenarthrobacter TaxID=2634190 RepID=UPI00380482F1
MLRRLAPTVLALTLLSGSLLSVGAAQAAAPGSVSGTISATTPTPSPASSTPSGPSTQTPTNPAPSQGASETPNPAGSGPANPGTGESDPQEANRTNVIPWVLGGIAVLIIIALIIWAVRGRRRSAYERR